jgi:hypothetical protein
MSLIVVNTWLVRSYTHQYEVLNLLSQVPLKIANQRVSDKLYFDVLDYSNYGVIHVSMDPFGLVSFAIESDAKDLEGASLVFVKDAEDLFVEKIMGSIQKVSYTQIKENIMPLGFHRVILSKTFKPRGVPEKKVGPLTIYYDDQRVYSTDCALYVYGSEDQKLLNVLDYFSFTVLAGKYIGTMVSIMAELYKKADAIVKEIDALGETSAYSKKQFTTLKGSIVETDFIRRDCSERYGKIQQATKNFEHTEQAYRKEKLASGEECIAECLNIEGAFERLRCDSDYLIPLWRDVLIDNLENLSFAVRARISFQESLETKKEQKEVRLLRHITVLSLAAALIKLGSTPSFRVSDLLVYGILAIIISALIIFVVEYFSGALRKKRAEA